MATKRKPKCPKIKAGQQHGRSSTPGPRVRRLDEIGKVRAELSVLYRMARTGEVTWADFAKAAYGLKIAAELLGFQKPTKIAFTTPDGEEPYSGADWMAALKIARERNANGGKPELPDAP